MLELAGIAARDGVLTGLDLTVAPGQRVALMGANGSGKSTLLYATVALTPLDGGTVRVDGLDPFERAHTLEVRRRVGFVQQRPDDQIVATSVEDDVAFGPENLGLDRAELRRRVSEALARVGLSGLEQREPHTLSGGQKQRLVIAGALALRPSYLLLDEPTSMLDPKGRAEVMAVLDELNAEGCGIVQVTHDLREAQRCGRVAVLANGRLAFDADCPRLEAKSDEQLHAWGIDRGLRPVTRAPFAGSRAEAAGCLSATDLSLRYELGNQEISALRGVTLSLSPGQLILVRGETGSGKSTLISLLAGLLTPDGGAVTLDGAALTPKDARGQVGLIFQDPESQLFDETVLADVAFGPRNLGLSKEAAFEAARACLTRVGLDPDDFGSRSPFRLSGGQARRVAIAGVLAMNPRFVLADEPTSGLDAAGRDQVRALLADLTGHCGVLIVTHSPEEFAGIATHSYELFHGEVVCG